jgi:hypothetical protein
MINFMKKISLFLLIIISLNACNDTSKTPSDNVSNVDIKTAPNDTVRTYIGLISHGSAGSFFRPCGRDSTRWAIVDSTGKMIDTYKKVYQYGYDNQSVMAFVQGSLLGRNRDAATDNTLKISQI